MFDSSKKPATIVTHGDDSVESTRDVSPPIHLTSTFAAIDAADFASMATESRHPSYYTRYGNPTVQRVEAVIAELEGAESAMLSATGMAAISATVLALTATGDHVVAQRNHYMGTAKLLSEVMPRFGVDITVVDQREPGAFADVIKSNTTLVLVETPANPTMQLTDLAAVAELARGAGAITLADNTFASPLNQKPLEFGIDLVMHSGTKYLGGHHDLLAGVVAGSKELIDRIWQTALFVGGTASPFDAWLLLRGMRTLPLRIERHNCSAMAIAEFLASHPNIERVHYPGLESHPQHKLAQAQMTGFGGVMSFEVAGGYETTRDFVSRLQLVKQAVSLGGYESLAVHAAAMWEGTLGDAAAREAGVQANLVRFAVGLEDASDLIADLDSALRQDMRHVSEQ